MAEHEQLRRHYNALARAVAMQGPDVFDRVTLRAHELLQGTPPSSPQPPVAQGEPPFSNREV